MKNVIGTLCLAWVGVMAGVMAGAYAREGVDSSVAVDLAVVVAVPQDVADVDRVAELVGEALQNTGGKADFDTVRVRVDVARFSREAFHAPFPAEFLSKFSMRRGYRLAPLPDTVPWDDVEQTWYEIRAEAFLAPLQKWCLDHRVTLEMRVPPLSDHEPLTWMLDELRFAQDVYVDGLAEPRAVRLATSAVLARGFLRLETGAGPVHWRELPPSDTVLALPGKGHYDFRTEPPELQTAHFVTPRARTNLTTTLRSGRAVYGVGAAEYARVLEP